MEELIINKTGTEKKLFEAGSCGATLARNLLRSLITIESGKALQLIDKVMEFALLRNCFHSLDQLLILEDIKNWIGGADRDKQYFHLQLLFNVLKRMNITVLPPLIEFSLHGALYVSDIAYAENTALETLKAQKKDTPLSLVVRSYDTLGRIYSDAGDYKKALEYFLKGAQSAHTARLIYEEWDCRTNAVWCLYAQKRNLESLHEIELAESLARRHKAAGMLSKTLIDKGNAELALGNLQKAKQAFLEALKAAEEDHDAKRQSDVLGNLGIIDYQEGKAETAAVFHRKALQISREIKDAESIQYDLNNLSSALWSGEKFEEAIKLKEEALELAKTRNDVSSISTYQASLKMMYTGWGKTHAAAALERAPDTGAMANPIKNVTESGPIKTGPSESFTIEMEVRKLLNENNLPGAKNLIEQHIAKAPNDLSSLSLYGTLLSISGDELSARKQFRDIILSSPDYLNAYFRLYTSYQKTGEFNAIIDEYYALLSDEPFNAGIRIVLALAYTDTGRLDEAINHAMQVIRLKPGEDLSYRVLCETQLAKAYSLLKEDWDGAWVIFQDLLTTITKLLQFDGEQKGQWYAYAAKSLHGFALESYLASPPFIGMGIEEVQVLSIAADYYYKAKELDATRNIEREINDIDNRLMSFSNARELTEAASYFILDGNQQGALFLLLLSVELDPQQAETFHQLAAYFFNMGDKEGALKQLERALQLDPLNENFLQKKMFFENQMFYPPKQPGNKK